MPTLFHRLDQLIARLVSLFEQPFSSRYSIILNAATDVTRIKADLIAENVRLRRQPIVPYRQEAGLFAN